MYIEILQKYLSRKLFPLIIIIIIIAFVHLLTVGKNYPYNLENKRRIKQLQSGVAYLYPLKTSKSFRFFVVFKEYRQAGFNVLKSAKNYEEAYICVKA